MRIYLIRHGKTPGNQLNRYIGITDEPVLEENQEQLKKQNYPKAERLFVSPLLRCRQTGPVRDSWKDWSSARKME